MTIETFWTADTDSCRVVMNRKEFTEKLLLERDRNGIRSAQERAMSELLSQGDSQTNTIFSLR